jgi:O-antigen/teichoic acid export membrane protein
MVKSLTSYQKIPVSAKASFWFMLTSVFQKSISFITVPVFTRILSQSEFGLISIYQSWLAILMIFATLTLWGGVFNNGMIKYNESKEAYLSTLLVLSTTITCIIFIIFLIYPSLFLKFIGLPKVIILFMFLQILFDPAINLWSAKQRFDFKYKKLVMLTIIISIFNPILGIIMVTRFENGGMARIMSIAIIQIVFGLAIYIHIITRGKSLFNYHYWKYAISFNVPLIPHYLSQTLLNQADRIMINNIIGADKAGIYSVAYSIGMILLFVITSINSTFTPWTYKKLTEKSYDQIGNKSILILVVISILILLLLCGSPEIVRLMAPPQYLEAIWVIPPIALSVFFIFLYGLFVTVEFYFEKNIFIMIASILAALLNIILNLMFIPMVGFIGAGYTTLISYIILSLLHFVFMQRIIRNSNAEVKIYDGKKLFAISIVLIAFSALVVISYKYLYLRFLFILAFVLIMFLNKNTVKKTLRHFYM